MAAIFSFFLHDVSAGTAKSDIEKYRSLLKKYRGIKAWTFDL
jgi:hypothetical protein